MGNNLFGIDIAGIVAQQFSGQLLRGVFRKKTAGTRTPGNLTAGTNPVTSSHEFDGFLEVSEVPAGDVAGAARSVLTIIGGSVRDGAVPEVGDRATIEDVTYELRELIERDPAGAVYKFLVQ